jgi:hypothetical protein
MPVKRTITGQSGARMTLGDLRKFVGSLDGLPDAATVKAKVTFRKHLRSVTVEEDDNGFDDFVRAVTPERGSSSGPRKVRPEPAKESTSA